ncbi:hypothetical protein [Frankia canadensis]|uniref:hypothetical protein n=1 Tax=Frankia canadensis TaxID=1836972 RepID=UPI001055CD8E|nr:hypothetical protein [Frankia canadensis]
MSNQHLQLSDALFTSRRYFDAVIAEHGWGWLRGSPADRDAEATRSQSGPGGGWSPEFLTGAVGYSCLYLITAARQVSSLGKLFLYAETDDLALTAPALIRSTLEHLAYASWILDPRLGNARRRIARGQLEGLASSRSWSGVASSFGDSKDRDRARGEYDLRQAQAKKIFYSSEIQCDQDSGDILKLAGERRPHTDKAIAGFGVIIGDRAFGRGLYKYLCAAAHPTAHAIQELLVATTRPDGKKDYRVGVADDDEYFARLAATAALGFHQAMRLFASYSGWPIEPLDSWLDEIRPAFSAVLV